MKNYAPPGVRSLRPADEPDIEPEPVSALREAEDYWAEVQTLRAELRALREAG